MDGSSPREPAQHPFLTDASAAHRQATTASRRLKGLRKASPSTHRFSPRSLLQPTAFTFISAARRFSIRSPSSVCPGPPASSVRPQAIFFGRSHKPTFADIDYGDDA